MFESVTGDDLLDGDVGSREEPHQPNQADADVLDGHQRRQALCVKRYNLEEGREDQRQETAADRADQWDDEVQLRYQDGESTCEDDQDGSEQQVDGFLPPLWHASHNWWYENLCWDVEL